MEIGKIQPGSFDVVRMLAVKVLQHIDRSQTFADEILDCSFPPLRNSGLWIAPSSRKWFWVFSAGGVGWIGFFGRF